MATTLDAQIAAASKRIQDARAARRLEFASGQDQAYQKGLTGSASSRYAREQSGWIEADAELTAATNEFNRLEAQRNAQTGATAYGTTTQYTTFDENGDAASVTTRTNVAGQPQAVSQTSAEPATPVPASYSTPTTSTPQTAAIPYISDEVYTATDDTVGWEAPPAVDLPAIQGTSDIDFLAKDDELYEPVPTDDELATIQENMEFAAADAEFANLQTDVEWTEDFYLDNADDLDAIAAKYGVDPTSPQARAIWEQEYGADDDLNLNANTNTGAATNSGATAPVARPPRSIHDGRRPIVDTDWRFRISLSPYADYLYNAPNPGILQPLKATDGVIFPYTPSVVRSSEASYQQYALTHSNFRGYFFTNSQEGDIMVTADFTAQDTNEAQYMLAMIHFFRSATKMWYGQDARRGTPPPLVYLRGLGEHQFNEHACLIRTFTYTLPDNVDYIKTSNSPTAQYAPKGRLAAGSGHESWSSKITRMITGGLEDFLTTGSLPGLNSLFGAGTGGTSLVKITDGATYVPTRLQIQLAMLPVQTRKQVSEEYSLQDFASGKLLKKGYW